MSKSSKASQVEGGEVPAPEEKNGTAAALDNLDAMISDEDAEIDAEADDLAAAVQKSAEDEAKEKADEVAREQGYKMGAAMAAGFMEQIIVSNMPHVVIAPEQKEQVAEKMVPVLRKYRGEMPPWLRKWKEEVELGMVLAGVGFGVYLQHRAHAQQVAQQAVEKARQESGQQQAPQQRQALSLMPPQQGGGDPLNLTLVDD
jgi:hypothetical protein